MYLKKNIDQEKLVSIKVNKNYKRELRKIGMELNDNLNAEQWIAMYKRLVGWDIEFAKLEDKGMQEVFDMQMKEANNSFAKFIEKYYLSWINGVEERPQM